MAEEAVPSPCTRICTLDPAAGLCIGCGRTLDEIAQWATASPGRQRRIVADAAARRAAMKAR